VPPRVSVVIPTYNAASTLLDALESVRRQTYQDYEIVVVDDGSSDETAGVVRDFSELMPTLRYCVQTNCGASVARQHGVSVARGAYIAALDADDVWLPEKLSQCVAAMDAEPRIGLCYSDGYLWDGQPSTDNLPRLSSRYAAGASGWQFNYFFKVGPAATSTMVFRKEALERVGGYNPTLRWGDFDICARVSAYYPVLYLHSPLALYRRHAASSSAAVTPTTVWGRLEFKRAARVATLGSVPGAVADRSVRLFGRVSPTLQLGLLLWWRISLGASTAHTARGIGRYGWRMLQSMRTRLVRGRGTRPGGG
jgi:glycosyltransferase involved in cell wall biosynthesis